MNILAISSAERFRLMFPVIINSNELHTRCTRTSDNKRVNEIAQITKDFLHVIILRRKKKRRKRRRNPYLFRD